MNGYNLINVTKTFLPPFDEFTTELKRAWNKGWITNYGDLVQELEEKLKTYLGVKHLIFCNNGTIALQIALKGLNIQGEVITTPFSYVATTGAILWENCQPVFVDISEKNFCIDASQMEASITDKTSAILKQVQYLRHMCMDMPATSKLLKRSRKNTNLKLFMTELMPSAQIIMADPY
jgi:dTDP-4-amino-4,6-dideoxygalactose transaminase